MQPPPPGHPGFAPTAPMDGGGRKPGLLGLALRTLWHNYCNFGGRATRREYWGFFLFHNISSYGFKLLTALAFAYFFDKQTMLAGRTHLWDEFNGTAYLQSAAQANDFLWGLLHDQWQAMTSTGAGIALLLVLAITLLLDVFFALPAWSVSVRRFHDVGWSGCWPTFGLASLLACYVFSFWTAHTLAVLSITGDTPSATILQYMLDGAAKLGTLCVGLSATLTLLFGLMQLGIGCLDSQRGLNKYGPSPKYPLG